MELQYLGANCLKITTKKSVIFSDPVSDIAKFKADLKKANIVLATQATLVPESTEQIFLVSSPGEYEFGDCSIKGVAAKPHTGSEGDTSATIYKVVVDDINLVILGHIDAKLSEDQLEAIGLVDLLVIPIGGGGYTLDTVAATNLVRSLEPKVVIPVHSKEDGINYDISQSSIQDFIKELGAPVVADQVDKYKPKNLPDQLTVQTLIRQ